MEHAWYAWDRRQPYRTSEFDHKGRLGRILFGIAAGTEEDEHLVLPELIGQDAAGLTAVGHVEEALATSKERRELLLKGVWHRSIGQEGDQRWRVVVVRSRGGW